MATASFGGSTAQAAWGPGGICRFAEGSHCYAIEEHGANALASIDFVDSMAMEIPKWYAGAFSTHEQWISFEASGVSGWIETGTIGGNGVDCCSLHPFYAEDQKNVFKEVESPGTVADHTYNHYVLYDSERNGRWHIYWGCCEVGYYGGGWPERFREQEAGVEVDEEYEPRTWMRQEVAWSNGGEWYPWSYATAYSSPGMCHNPNPESGAEGNIEAGTKLAGAEIGRC